jgi:hypothetical protein
MILKSAPGYIKTRPRPHKLEGITTKQHEGFVMAKYPKAYPITAPQRKVRDAARTCGIKKGMSRNDLVNKMRSCIPGQFGR